jgi:molybdopterin/thiamine biosynthesis adenylyltransferase
MSATDELRPWVQRLPERLRWELANFADRGLRAELWPRENDPLIQTTLELSDRRRVEVRVTFPFEYPLKPPFASVAAGLLGLPHEVEGHLCIFDDPTNQWNPQRGAAALVDENVRGLLEAVLIEGPAAIEAKEEQIPDQVSRRYAANPNRVMLVPDPFWATLADGVRVGALLIRGGGSHRLLAYAEGLGFDDSQLATRLGSEEGLAFGRWVELADPPSGHQGAAGLLSRALAATPGLLDPVLIGDNQPTAPEWIGLNFPDQGPRRGQWRRQWAFIELSAVDTIPVAAQELWTTQALTLAERQLRIPELVGLEKAKVVLLGAGSLGSSVAIELAKAGCGELQIIDPDTYDVNNAIRHELAPSRAGAHKAEALAVAADAANPFGEAKPMVETVGVGRISAINFLQCLDGADLVVETTGSHAVTRIAERYCRIVGVPLLSASLTSGSRGGDMVLLDPELCFDCFLLAQQAGDIPSPSAAEQELVIPAGCADPAFSGAGFDASALASDVARMAVRATGLTGYPPLDHRWAVTNFVEEPHWQQGNLEPDPRCGHHR